jgi:hypothetical protein
MPGMTMPELNALLNSIEIIVLTILALRVTLLLNARKREIDSLHEELHQKNDLLEIRRQRIDLLERSERLHAAERTDAR